MKKKIRQLSNRSGQELCSICKEPHILQEHHINGRNVPNYKRAWNITNICANCHDEIHFGKIVIEKWVMTTSGRELIWHKKGEESITGFESTPHMII